MCARRFLIAIFVLTLLVVAAAFAIFQWGGNILLKQATPTGRFEAAEAGTGPNYAQATAWIARPGATDDPTSWDPSGAADLRVHPITVDAQVFYVHPTTYLDRDRWNAPLQPSGQTEFRTRLFVQTQASAFTQDAQVWAPRYRQAAYGAFLLDSQDARAALDLAYADVAAAFDQFLKENPDSPIILAAHSQGALHLERLLREKVAGKSVADRIVAAYVIGWPISAAADLPALGLGACQRPDESGCILSWMSFGQPANPELVLHSYEKSAGFLGTRREREDMLCVNPLTGTRNGTAPPADNPGTLVPSADLQSARLVPGQVGAHCEQGLLMLDGAIPAMGPYVLPGNNYHVYDYALFWQAIRNDAVRRLAAWRR
jgi:hypothetical protein